MMERGTTKPSSPIHSPYVSPLSPGVHARRAKREFFKRIISQWTKHSMVECFELWRDVLHSRDLAPHREMSIIPSDAAEHLHHSNHSKSSEPPPAISRCLCTCRLLWTYRLDRKMEQTVDHHFRVSVVARSLSLNGMLLMISQGFRREGGGAWCAVNTRSIPS